MSTDISHFPSDSGSSSSDDATLIIVLSVVGVIIIVGVVLSVGIGIAAFLRRRRKRAQLVLKPSIEKQASSMEMRRKGMY